MIREKILRVFRKFGLPIVIFAFVSTSTWAGKIGKWQQFSSLPGGRYEHACVGLNNFLYVLGGHTGGGKADTVFFTRVNPDGSLGLWQTTTPLPEEISYVRAVAYKNWIYVLGGNLVGGNSGKVYRGTVSADGTIAKWELMSSRLPKPKSSCYGTSCGAAVVYNNTIYYVSGWYSREIFFSTIKEDGSLGEWKEAQHLPSPRGFGRAFAFNGFLYLVGGNTRDLADTLKEDVYRAKIKEDGSLGNWSRTTSLPVPNAGFACVLVKDRVFVFGGEGLRDKTLSAGIDQEGNLGEWSEEEPLLEERWSFDGVYLNGWVYVIGGFTKCGYVNPLTGRFFEDGSVQVDNKVYGAPVCEVVATSTADTVVIDQVRPNKILYLYDETATAEISLKNNTGTAQKGILSVREEWDLDQSREVWSRPVEVPPWERKTVKVEWKTGPPMYGRALRAFFQQDGKVVTKGVEFYQVADPKEWFRCFLNFLGGPHHGGDDSKEAPSGSIKEPFRTYCNYDNYFSYMLSGFSHQAPEEDEWIGGQGRHHIVKKDLIRDIQKAKQLGVRAGAYTIGVTAGPAGYEFARQHPEWFLRDKKGAFFLPPTTSGVSPIEVARKTNEPLSGWYALQPDFGNPDVVQYIGEELVRAIKMFGFDAIFFDGIYGFYFGVLPKHTLFLWNGEPASREEGVDKLSVKCVKKVREIIHATYPDVALWYNYAIPHNSSIPLMLRLRLNNSSIPLAGDPLYEAKIASLQDFNCGTLKEFQGRELANPDIPWHYWRNYYEMYVDERNILLKTLGDYDPVFAGGWMYDLDPLSLMTPAEFSATRDTWTTANHIGAIFTAARVHPCWNDSWGFRPYAQFMTRYSALLWSRDVKLESQPFKRISVESNREVWWEECVYTRQINGYRDTLIHLINSPDKEEADFKATSDPEPAKGVEIEVKDCGDPKEIQVWALQPYGYNSPEKEPIVFQLTPKSDGKNIIIEVPAFSYYTLVVIREKNQ